MSTIVGASDGALEQLQQNYEAVVQRVSPSVVVIETSVGLGSGIVFDAAGDIVQILGHADDGTA